MVYATCQLGVFNIVDFFCLGSAGRFTDQRYTKDAIFVSSPAPGLSRSRLWRVPAPVRGTEKMIHGSWNTGGQGVT